MEEFPQFDPTIAEEFGFDTATAGSTFLGTPLFEADSLINLFIRFFFNLLMCWIITQFFYYKKSKRRDYYLTFMLFSATMFVLIFLMENVKLQIGFTLGLFAIFGMIRYRTETVPVRVMTYLFIIIGISVINGLAMAVSVAELVCANLLIDLIVPEKREELMADLRKRTGIQNIQKIEIGHIDFLRDVAYIKLYYILGKNETNTIDTITKFKES